jgi:hypothetical protein
VGALRRSNVAAWWMEAARAPTPTLPQRGRESMHYCATTNFPSFTCSITPVSFV